MATQIPLSQIDRCKGVKSSCSGPNGACVMVLKLENGDVVTWNSRAGDDETAHVHTPEEWDAFIEGVVAGEFNRENLPVA